MLVFTTTDISDTSEFTGDLYYNEETGEYYTTDDEGNFVTVDIGNADSESEAEGSSESTESVVSELVGE
jgi:hypothetical protein